MNEATAVKLEITIHIHPDQLTPILDMLTQRLSAGLPSVAASHGQEDSFANVPKQKLAFSVNEAAEVLGICPKTVYRLLSRGLLKSSNALRTKLIPRAELENFLKKTVSK